MACRMVHDRCVSPLVRTLRQSQTFTRRVTYLYPSTLQPASPKQEVWLTWTVTASTFLIQTKPFQQPYNLSSDCDILAVPRLSKTNHVTGCGGPYGRKTSRRPHFLDTRLTDGGKVVSLTRRPPFALRKIPDTNFC
jgi:hypothetical protein